MNLEEYEPESNPTDAGNPYVPAPVETQIENDEYEPELDNVNGESNYTPAIDLLAKNYVNIYKKVEKIEVKKVENNNSESDSDSSDDSEFEFKPVTEEVRNKNALTEEEKQNCGFSFSKHDLTPESLPVAPDVSAIVVPPQLKMIELGAIEKIMENPIALLIIQSTPDQPPLADESLIFRSDRKPIGLIFETFGPVKRPFYSVRFNSLDDLTKLNLKISDSIFYSPDFSEIVQTEKLMKQKGCDASWEDDKECPSKFLEFSDDEAEKSSRQAHKERNKRKQETTTTPQTEAKRIKEEKTLDSTLYICGLPPDFRESSIKDLFKMFGVKKVHLLRYPDNTSKCSGFVTCQSKEKAMEAIERLNMKITLPGAEMPLAVKFSDGPKGSGSQRKSVDLDRPSVSDEYRVTYASNRSTILTGERYKLKDRRQSAPHTLHTLMPDPDDKFGAGHAFVKKFEKTTVLEKNNQPTDSTNQNLTIPEIPTNATTAVNDDDVFSWGASTLGTVSSSTTSRPYFGDRTLPPELANPEAHPSPFGETVKKAKQAELTTAGINVKQEAVGKNGSLVAVQYDSASDDSDPENPSCMAFCEKQDSKKVVPQPRRQSSTSTPSDARRDFTVLNGLFEKAVHKK